jgi:hypothetical protein
MFRNSLLNFKPANFLESFRLSWSFAAGSGAVHSFNYRGQGQPGPQHSSTRDLCHGTLVRKPMQVSAGFVRMSTAIGEDDHPLWQPALASSCIVEQSLSRRFSPPLLPLLLDGEAAILPRRLPSF